MGSKYSTPSSIFTSVTLPNKQTRRGKWTNFSGSDEELARVALDHAKYLAAKRRPLLQQISHSRSRRNGFNCQDDYDTDVEHWAWSPNNSYNDYLSLQAENCSFCGNYICVSTIEFPLIDTIQCKCNNRDNSYTENDSYDGLEEFKEYEEIV